MSLSDEVLRAYHRKIDVHREKTGMSYPLTRTSCIEFDAEGGNIFDTSVIDPQLVATFKYDSLDRVRIKLV